MWQRIAAETLTGCGPCWYHCDKEGFWPCRARTAAKTHQLEPFRHWSTLGYHSCIAHALCLYTIGFIEVLNWFNAQ